MFFPTPSAEAVVTVYTIEPGADLASLIGGSSEEIELDESTVRLVTTKTLDLYASDDPRESLFGLSVASISGDEWRTQLVVETIPEMMRRVLMGLRIGGLDDAEIERISSAFRRAGDAWEHGDGEPGRHEADTADAVEAMWMLSSRLLGERGTALAEIDAMQAAQAGGNKPDPEKINVLRRRVEMIRGLLMKSIGCAATLEERDFNNLRVQYFSRLARMKDDASSAVAILVSSDSDGGFEFRGSGFVYRDCVVTCVHLFELDDVRRDGAGCALVEQRIRVVPIDWLGTTGVGVGLTLAAESRLFPELDVAAVRLAEAVTDQEREWRSAIQARVASGGLAYGSGFDAHVGVLYGFGALPDSGPDGSVVRARWIPFGRIVFPHVVCPQVMDVDAHGNAAGTFSPDARYVRAFAAALFHEPVRLCESEFQERAIKEVDEVYDLCEQAGVMKACRFRQTIGPGTLNAQIATDAEFRRVRRFPCFGTDLATESGLSGAPLFLMSSDGRSELVAMHHGRAGAIESNDFERRSLRNAGIAIPLSAFVKEIEAWLE